MTESSSINDEGSNLEEIFTRWFITLTRFLDEIYAQAFCIDVQYARSFPRIYGTTPYSLTPLTLPNHPLLWQGATWPLTCHGAHSARLTLLT